MATITNLQETTSLGTNDQTILRQGTIDKRISLHLAGILSWATREGYTYLGDHATSTQFVNEDSFTIYQGRPYFVKEGVTLPYTTNQSNASADTNLEVKTIDSTIYNSVIGFKIGNISDYSGDNLSSEESNNSYQYPDDSDEWYAPSKDATYPLTIPANPKTAEDWMLISLEAESVGDLTAYHAATLSDVTNGSGLADSRVKVLGDQLVPLKLNQTIFVNNLYGDVNNPSGVLAFKVVTAGTNTADGENYYNVEGGQFQLEALKFNGFDSEIKDAAYISKLLSEGTSVTFAGFGDSTMWGAAVGDLLNQDTNNPLDVLSRTLVDVYGPTSTVNNYAISGSAMFQLMAGTDGSGAPFEDHLKSGGKAANADVIICNHGINDCQTNIDLASYKTNWVKFVKICRSYGKVPVLVTPNQITALNIGDQRETREIFKYVSVVREVAREMNCALVDQYYYFEKTAKKLPLVEIVGDGVHPTSQGYLQAGKNLLIPFVGYQVVSKEGDLIYPSGSTYLDSNSNLAITERSDTKFGVQYSSTRIDGVLTANSTCALFDEPVQDLAFNMLHWGSGSEIVLGVQGNPVTTVKAEKLLGDRTFLDWDSDFLIRCNVWAGLNVVLFGYDPSYTDPAHNQMSMCGVTLPSSDFSHQVPMSGDVYAKDSHKILTRRKLSTKLTLARGGNALRLVDKSGTLVFDVVLLTNGDLYARVHDETGQLNTLLLASGILDGDYAVELNLNTSSIDVVVGGVSGTLNYGGYGFLPPMWLANRGVQYSVSVLETAFV
ncbi:hypothetical protein VPHK406_0069 [Vibrio phage K406]